MSIDLSIITVTYCSAEHIERLIRSVQKSSQKITYEHLIVDNGSTDNTVDLIRSFGDTVICIANKENRGFAAANLQGYQQAKGKYLLFLNPDMEIEEKGFHKIVSWMDQHPKTAIMGCQLLDRHGNLNMEAAPRRFPRLFEQFILLLKLQKFFSKAIDHYYYRDLDLSKEQPVETVRGSFMVMRRELIDTLGWPFDPRYFIWFEDVDICREAWNKGFNVVYNPSIKCKDAIGQSFQQRDRKWRFKQYAKSLLCYFKKWEPFYVWCWIPLVYIPLSYLIGTKTMGTLISKLKKIFSPRKEETIVLFRESRLAHNLLDGKRGIEIGASAHNPFGLKTLNIDYAEESFKKFENDELRLCGKVAPVHWTASGDDLPFKDNTVDFVLSSHVIEHFYDPVKTIKEWLRVVKPGGYVYIIAPHKERTRDAERTRTTLNEIIQRNEHPNPPEIDHHSHHSIWITEDFLEICNHYQWNVIAVQDEDDKVGNGFTVVLQK